ncbi:InlB B-repeat-containing protein [Paenibacillus albus]|uniref:SLH domain-containing protein n=1 Tax=Paenibacillus albus TaxID=2495582 RepID=A0A3S9ABN5_9BACL|nr:InlB B-repeat-containing protein [Paenibacillus albus]AZN43115.1 hypothetical protein EJC50_28000 [Paenibacillus albus]
MRKLWIRSLFALLVFTMVFVPFANGLVHAGALPQVTPITVAIDNDHNLGIDGRDIHLEWTLPTSANTYEKQRIYILSSTVTFNYSNLNSYNPIATIDNGTTTSWTGNSTIVTDSQEDPLATGIYNAYIVPLYSDEESYVPDGKYLSGPLYVYGDIASTTSIVPPASTTVSYGAQLSLQASVTGAYSTIFGYEGTVQFYDNEAPIGNPVSFLGGSTVWFFFYYGSNELSVGTHEITAKYSGAKSAASSMSEPLTITVTPANSVTYNGNGNTLGTMAPASAWYAPGATVTIAGNTMPLPMTKSGFTFAGWNTQADGEGTHYAVGETFEMASSNLVLYAEWAPIATYSISYNGNGSTSGLIPTSNTYAAGELATVHANDAIIPLSKIGYKFAGWNTQENGNGTHYAALATFNMPSNNLVLYAEWAPLYSFSYDGNGSTSGPMLYSGYHTSGEQLVVESNNQEIQLVKTGYTFLGWNTEADGTGIHYDVEASFTMPSHDVTLYAEWESNLKSVSYNGNGQTSGDVPIGSVSYGIEDTVTVRANNVEEPLVKRGFTFDGWNTQANGLGEHYDADDTFTMPSHNVVLYAEWTPNHYSVTYNGNSSTAGYVPVDHESYVYGATVSVSDNDGETPLTRTGYTFAGWNTAADGSGTSYSVSAGTTFTMSDANVVLYAQWMSIEHTVSFNSNGGSTVQSQTIAEGGHATLPQQPTRSGYTFVGWYGDSELVTQFNFSETTINADRTIYAKWKIVSVTKPPVTDTKVVLVLGTDENKQNQSAMSEITKEIGTNLTLSAALLTADGKPLNLPNIVISANGEFSLTNVSAGQYQVVLNVIAPTGEKLAGRMGKLTVKSDGSAKMEVDLIDPYGIITDAMTGSKLDGVKVTLHWSDTELNRSKGRTPGDLVVLPELPDFAPNKNHDPQMSVGGGQYGWMVFPDGDYYIVGEKDGYETFDSRNDTRSEQQGADSYIKEGIIHVGQSIVHYDFKMKPKAIASGMHKAYMAGYPDGSFAPQKGIRRAELAAILSRIMPVDQTVKDAKSFVDVKSTHWAAGAISLAAKQHWMQGYPAGTFNPEKEVTRAEFVQALFNIYQWDASAGKSFSDVKGHWAAQAITAAEKQGILQGYPDGTFHPDQAISRVEAVMIFNKLLNRIPAKIEAAPKWTDVTESFWGYNAIMEASTTHEYVTYEGGSEFWQAKK